MSENWEPGWERRVVFADKDEPLRDDVRTLGALVGDVLTEQLGDTFFERVESVRTAAIRRREGDEEALSGRLSGKDLETRRALIRAFAAYFQVVNLAEQVHRIRRRRDYENLDDGHQPAGLVDAFKSLKESGLSVYQAADAVSAMRIEPVFTAHPTESVRRVILEKEQRIAHLLTERFDPSLTPREEHTHLARIREEITTAWQTHPHAPVQPTVMDELEHVLFFMTEVVYRVVPPFHEALHHALGEVWGDEAAEVDLAGMLRFGSWVGGDMDGNPNVTASTIRSTVAAHRRAVIRLYRRELLNLAGRLSQSREEIGISDEVFDRIAHYHKRFPDVTRALSPRRRDMPYRALLRYMEARLRATLQRGDETYTDADGFRADLDLIAGSLSGNRGAQAGLYALNRLRIRERVFGFHLATLDVRQDSAVLHEAVGALLKDDEWNEREPDARAEKLREELRLGIRKVNDVPDGAKDMIEVFRAIHECREQSGPNAVRAMIISMTRQADDVLAVLFLARAAGLVDGGEVPLDVVPLFETVGDLKAAGEVMQGLLADAHYRKHLASRGDRQQVMVGYSDSNKDGGITASRWTLHDAQDRLVRVMDEADVAVTFFHGRGGSISRGGGKTHRAIVAAPRGSVNGQIRVTEQGEVINQKYGLRGIAMRNLEQLTAAVIVATHVRGDEPAPDSRWRLVMERLAAVSRATYRGIVYQTPGFYDYFRAATPIDVIERMRIGSRPASRSRRAGIAGLRAIPWVFAWGQSRHGIPGWLGLGPALKAVREEFDDEVLTLMLNEWPVFRALIEDVEMVLAKVDMSIAARYSALAGEMGEKHFKTITDEYELTVAQVLAVTGNENLLDREPTLQRSIYLRNPYIDPMSCLQVELLAEWREGERQDDDLFEALMTSVNGIARGMRNTG